MKHYLEEILELLKNKGYHYFIEDYGYICQDITNDPKLCHATKDNIYQGVNAVDDCTIHILKHDKNLTKENSNAYQNEKGDWIIQKGYEHIGFIRWTNWNDGIERVIDYAIDLDNIIDFGNFAEDWQNRLESL